MWSPPQAVAQATPPYPTPPHRPFSPPYTCWQQGGWGPWWDDRLLGLCFKVHLEVIKAHRDLRRKAVNAREGPDSCRYSWMKRQTRNPLVYVLPTGATDGHALVRLLRQWRKSAGRGSRLVPVSLALKKKRAGFSELFPRRRDLWSGTEPRGVNLWRSSQVCDDPGWPFLRR